jgi:putative endonuclease
MNYTVYILFSAQLTKYYVGVTSLSIEERLRYHLSTHDGYTSKAKDWIIIYTIEIEDKITAYGLERNIKKRGASRYLKDIGKG